MAEPEAPPQAPQQEGTTQVDINLLIQSYQTQILELSVKIIEKDAIISQFTNELATLRKQVDELAKLVPIPDPPKAPSVPTRPQTRKKR